MNSENLQIASIRKPDEGWKVALFINGEDGETVAFVEMEPIEAQLFASLVAVEGDKANQRNAS